MWYDLCSTGYMAKEKKKDKNMSGMKTHDKDCQFQLDQGGSPCDCGYHKQKAGLVPEDKDVAELQKRLDKLIPLMSLDVRPFRHKPARLSITGHIVYSTVVPRGVSNATLKESLRAALLEVRDLVGYWLEELEE